ncbi:MAG: hypothetical protein F6K26_04995 [Moorea sp. SIO2I5]|nr:hypothetical protein [Moorena sp. SIO2I5]
MFSGKDTGKLEHVDKTMLPMSVKTTHGNVSPPLGGYMNSSVNGLPDSAESSGIQPPEVSSLQNQPPEKPTGGSQDTTKSDPLAESNGTVTTQVSSQVSSQVSRQHPIPAPSEPRQYRAIGLVNGKYMPSAEQLTRGTLVAADGTLIDAVLLGRVMSLVKNHLDLNQPHLWVVYPRIRQADDNLHVQIVGVWEPETLEPTAEAETTDSGVAQSPAEVETSNDCSEAEVEPIPKDGYFSIRGEVIYHSRENEQVVVKIRQLPRKESDKPKFFKLKLKGCLGERVVGHFWDLHAQLQANTLVIQEGNDIGFLNKKGPKRKPFNKNKKRFGAKKSYPKPRPARKKDGAATATAPKPQTPRPKPIKRIDKGSQGDPSGNFA